MPLLPGHMGCPALRDPSRDSDRTRLTRHTNASPRSLRTLNSHWIWGRVSGRSGPQGHFTGVKGSR